MTTAQMLATLLESASKVRCLQKEYLAEEHEEECELILKEAIAAESELDAVIDRINAKVLQS